jgi:hypothetical protein
VRCEVLIAVTMNNTIVWYVTPCSLGDTYERFGETCWQQIHPKR